jgi:hypothetical protein
MKLNPIVGQILIVAATTVAFGVTSAATRHGVAYVEEKLGLNKPRTTKTTPVEEKDDLL